MRPAITLYSSGPDRHHNGWLAQTCSPHSVEPLLEIVAAQSRLTRLADRGALLAQRVQYNLEPARLRRRVAQVGGAMALAGLAAIPLGLRVAHAQAEDAQVAPTAAAAHTYRQVAQSGDLMALGGEATASLGVTVDMALLIDAVRRRRAEVMGGPVAAEIPAAAAPPPQPE